MHSFTSGDSKSHIARPQIPNSRNPLKASHRIIPEKPDSASNSYSDSFEEESSSSDVSPTATLRTDIINRLSSMPHEKLLSVLNFIESLEPKPAPGRPKPVIHKGKRPYSGKVNEHTCEIELRVLSTWGHAHLAGLTEIEFFSSSQDQIKIPPGQIHIKNAGVGALSNPNKMVNGEKHTDDEKNMWVVPLPVPPLNLEIIINLTEYPAGMRLWNYNKSFLESVKGIKELQVYKDKELVWEGQVKRGSGSKYDEYFTDIALMHNFSIKIQETEAVPVWVESKNTEEKKSKEKRLRPVASVPRSMNINDEDLRFERANPSIGNVKTKTNATSRERKVAKDEVGLIPEPTLRILGFNSKRKEEPLKESLESLEFFKITNESRIKRERIIVNPKVNEGVKKTELSDPLEKFVSDHGKGVLEVKPVQDLRMPNMPRGQLLRIRIFSTWGDKHYVGLSGIEIFDSQGDPIKFLTPKTQISAVPADVNILPGYGTDPRTIDKLLDGVNWTCDDLHVWLAPYTKNQVNIITIDFLSTSTISMIRLWNYNKSRIHSFRGAKDLEISLDDRTIFKGEIQKAPGRILDADQYCEYLVFTKDEGIINRIDTFDWVKDFEHNTQADNELMSTIRLQNRPGTASKNIGEDGRPKTSAKIAKMPQQTSSVFGRKFRILILNSWGDAYYVGFTGIEIQGANGPIPVQKTWIDANPRDMNVIPGYSGDYRTLEKLINQKNQTSDDHNMWLIPFTKGKHHYIDIDLQEPVHVTGIVLWNYNKNPEDTARGVKDAIIYMDGKNLTEPFVTLRKAPGNCEFDFGQFLSLPLKESAELKITGTFASSIVKQDYETPCMPSGYLLTIKILSTWGDMHYVGLNGIEIFDMSGKEVQSSARVSAKPGSVKELSEMENDVRTVEKLIDGFNNTKDEQHMWLAPYLTPGTYFNMGGGVQNEVNFVFDRKITLSYIRFWNYAKTPERACKEIMILFDDGVVYKGFLRQHGASTVLFTGEPGIVQRACDQVYLYEGDKLNVLLYNEGKLVGGLEESKVVQERPMTSVVRQY